MKDEKIPDAIPKSFPLSYEKEALPGGTCPKNLLCHVFSSDAKDPPLFPDLPEFPCPRKSPIPSVFLLMTSYNVLTDIFLAPAKLLLTLEIDLGAIPDWKPELREDNRSYWFVNFEVYMKLYSAKLEFFLGRGKEKYKPKHVTYHSQRS